MSNSPGGSMFLTRHRQDDGNARWALDGEYLPKAITLDLLLQFSRDAMERVLYDLPRAGPATHDLMAPIEAMQEVWASGVTYRRSRAAREAESAEAGGSEFYARVFEAERPELFFKAIGWRVVGTEATVRIRTDSAWSVPEPELALLVNSRQEIVGYTAGNDMSARDIEAANPLYLPQSKIYDQSCSLGDSVVLVSSRSLAVLPIRMEIRRGEEVAFAGETSTSSIVREFSQLLDFLFRETDFPAGVWLMTGTGIVPGDDFTLEPGDVIRIDVGSVSLVNVVSMHGLNESTGEGQ